MTTSGIADREVGGTGDTRDGRGTPKASHKTLLVMEAAVHNRRFTDIVEATQLSKSTVHRILGDLVGEGFIEGDASSGFRAGHRLLKLSGRALTTMDIGTVGEPVVEELVRDVDCTVHVGVASGDEMVYVIRKDAPNKPYRMRSRVGLAIPMHTSGMGKVTLAHWSDADVRGYAERTGLPSRTPTSLTSLDALQASLAQIRDQGFALDLGENEVGTVCVSAPIADHTGRVTHGLSISSIALEHPGDSIKTLAPRAVQAAQEISRLLGSAS